MDSKTNVFGVKIDPGRVLNTGFPAALRKNEKKKIFFSRYRITGEKKEIINTYVIMKVYREKCIKKKLNKYKIDKIYLKSTS